MAAKSITVTNISTLLSDSHLRELFECCGDVTSCTLSGEGDARTCVITYAQEAHAKAAVFLSGSPLGDKNLIVTATAAAKTLSTIPAPASSSAKQYGTTTIGPDGKATTSTSQHLFEPSTAPSMLMSSDPEAFAAQQRRLDEIARTVYIGNLGITCMEEHIQQYFGACGPILYIKMAGDAAGLIKYAFVEFGDIPSAQKSLMLTGSILIDRPIKVGKANNPIIKTQAMQNAEAEASNSSKKRKDPAAMSAILAKIAAAKKKVDKKLGVETADDDKDKGKRSRSRSSGRDRKRSRRSRSKESRERSALDRLNKDREKDSKKAKKGPDRTGMFFNGYAWAPIEPETAPPS